MMSFHFSAATSFNTSGDAYSLSAANVDIPPEQSINLELGAKIDSADGNFTTRLACSAAPSCTSATPTRWSTWSRCRASAMWPGRDRLQRPHHAAAWEVFASYMWLPVANIDEGVAGPKAGHAAVADAGHSGTVWATYKFTPQLRVGAGLNARSSQTPLRNPLGGRARLRGGRTDGRVHGVAGQLTLKGNLSNVTNKLYADALYTNHYIPGAGRLFQLTGSWKF
jgi:catecholate siderophore receptor